uniref:Small ubiquitin-related modifier 3-like n=1 Tax=Crassostrea virginica TaxID=6565 RepID=A0A8B8DC50_CRAVI|nr:small ubiquitin-related modifier 3-like [Crassostrea virginica]
MSEEKKDDIKPESSELITLKVTGQDRSVVFFKIKKNTPLRKLMSAYCDRAGLKLGVVRFRFDGNPINETDTPSGLDMENGDDIDVFQQHDDIKPESSELITLKVTGQDRSVVFFKIKKNTPLRKLMSAYCDRAGLKLGVVRFRFDGNPINETDTPSGLDMENGDDIDVFQQPTGGLL